MNPDDNIRELRSNLSLDFNLGPSQAKKSKFENCVLETPDFAKIAFPSDTGLGPHTKKMRYEACILGTPDIQKIGLSTPELDKLAMRTDFGLPTPSLNTFLRNDDSDEDKQKLAQQWANSKPAKKDEDDLKFVPTIRTLTSTTDFSQSNNDQLNMDQDPMAPIDMGQQEKIKLERKRYRNRIAASKCRQRKLERISKLQERVNKLENKNLNLEKYIGVLQEILGRLNGHINAHKKIGCEVHEYVHY